MKIPNADKAIVDIAKIRDYCLNPTHVRGRHKARVFESVLGMTSEHADDLKDALLVAVLIHEAILGEHDEYGQRYMIDFEIEWNGKSAIIHSAWIILKDEDYPRLTTCYII